MRVRIDLPGIPRGKGRGRAVSTPQGARVYTDAKTRSYEARLAGAAAEVMERQGGGACNRDPAGEGERCICAKGECARRPTDLPVRLTMSVFFAVPQSWSKKKRAQALAGTIWPTVKPDADNTLKLTDALNGIVWVDDKQVVIATVFKSYSDQPGLMIEVETLAPPVLVGRVLVQRPESSRRCDVTITRLTSVRERTEHHD